MQPTTSRWHKRSVTAEFIVNRYKSPKNLDFVQIKLFQPRENGIYYDSTNYAKAEADMTIAKLFMNGRSQAVRLPKEFRFEDEDEVMIKRMGDVVMLIPKNKWEDIFVNALKSFPKDVEFDRVDNQSDQGREIDL